MPMMQENLFAENFALCHLCFCWVNKQGMVHCTAEEACLADHSQTELAEMFRQEEEACAAGLALRKEPAASSGIRKKAHGPTTQRLCRESRRDLQREARIEKAVRSCSFCARVGVLLVSLSPQTRRAASEPGCPGMEG